MSLVPTLLLTLSFFLFLFFKSFFFFLFFFSPFLKKKKTLVFSASLPLGFQRRWEKEGGRVGPERPNLGGWVRAVGFILLVPQVPSKGEAPA